MSTFSTIEEATIYTAVCKILVFYEMKCIAFLFFLFLKDTLNKSKTEWLKLHFWSRVNLCFLFWDLILLNWLKGKDINTPTRFQIYTEQLINYAVFTIISCSSVLNCPVFNRNSNLVILDNVFPHKVSKYSKILFA